MGTGQKVVGQAIGVAGAVVSRVPRSPEVGPRTHPGRSRRTSRRSRRSYPCRTGSRRQTPAGRPLPKKPREEGPVGEGSHPGAGQEVNHRRRHRPRRPPRPRNRPPRWSRRTPLSRVTRRLRAHPSPTAPSRSSTRRRPRRSRARRRSCVAARNAIRRTETHPRVPSGPWLTRPMARIPTFGRALPVRSPSPAVSRTGRSGTAESDRGRGRWAGSPRICRDGPRTEPSHTRDVHALAGRRTSRESRSTEGKASPQGAIAGDGRPQRQRPSSDREAPPTKSEGALAPRRPAPGHPAPHLSQRFGAAARPSTGRPGQAMQLGQVHLGGGADYRAR